MTRDQIIDEIALALLGFVKEASSGKATIEELEVLPRVVEELIHLLALNKETYR